MSAAGTFDPDVLRIRCSKCGGALTVQCGPQEAAAGPQDVRCAFCGHVEPRDVNARILWVTGGHERSVEARGH